MENNNKHDLFWELEAFNPRWQAVYRTLALAAKAAKVLPLYADWLKSADGVRYLVLMHDVPDTLEQNRIEREIREAMMYQVRVDNRRGVC